MKETEERQLLGNGNGMVENARRRRRSDSCEIFEITTSTFLFFLLSCATISDAGSTVDYRSSWAFVNVHLKNRENSEKFIVLQLWILHYHLFA